jgi:hypothetical protein
MYKNLNLFIEYNYKFKVHLIFATIILISLYINLKLRRIDNKAKVYLLDFYNELFQFIFKQIDLINNKGYYYTITLSTYYKLL